MSQPRYFVYQYPKFFCVTDQKGAFQTESKSYYYDYTGKQVIVNDILLLTSKSCPLAEFEAADAIPEESDFVRDWASEIINPSQIDSQTWV
jgi:hypothetical protein